MTAPTPEELRSAPPATLDVDVCRALDSAAEFRAADGEDDDSIGTMVGHFSTLNDWYEIDSWFEGNFLERLAPGAFKRTIKNRSGQSPIRVLLEHGYDPNVGDKPLGVPRVLEERDTGAYSEVPLFDTSYNTDLMPALRGGAYGQSFRFRVLRDEWDEEPETSDDNPKGIPERTIKEVRLIEFGPTIFPANPATDAGLRSTTDDFYERMRRRDPAAYDDAVARSKTLRIPAEPTQPGHSPAEPPHSEDPPERSVPQDTRTEHSPDPQEPAAADPPGAHSTPNKSERSSVMDTPMTVEERTARQSEIRARLAEIDTEHAGATLPTEVQEEWDNLRTEYDEHDSAIEAQEARRADLASRAVDNPKAGESVRQTAPSTVRRPENIYDLSEIRQQARSVDDLPRLYRDNAMRAVEQTRFPGAKDRAAAQAQVERLLDSVDDRDGTLARRILVTGSPTYDRAFGKAVTAGSTMGLTSEEQRALSLGGGSPAGEEGGFAVPYQLDPTVILTSAGVIDPLRQISRVVQITGKEWQGVTSAGATVTRSNEAAEVGDNSFVMEQPTVKAERVTGFVPFSFEIDQDWTAMRSEITNVLADAKATEEASSFITGDGTPPAAGGIVATLASGSHVDAAGEGVVVGDLYKVEEALPPRFRSRGRWLANKSIYNLVRRFDTAGGADLWVRLADGLPPELIGYPAHEASEMDGTINAAATGTNLVLLFGDFQQFLIVDRVGMSVELVPHLFHTTSNRPSGQRGLLAVWRNNSKVLVDNAFRLLKVSTTA